MKLAKYLADYVEQEVDEANKDGLVIYYEQIIQQGIEAFASTEDVRVEVISGGYGANTNTVERIV